MTLTFLCDVDGVLADFLGGICGVLKERGYPDIRRERVVRWDIASCLDVPSKVIYDIAGCEGFCECLEVLPGAVALVDTLRHHGDVYFVTSPVWSARTWMFERTRWLREYFDVKPSEVVHTSAKHLVRGDVLIDDKPETINQWLLAQPGTDPYPARGVVWDQPYNRNPPWAEGVRGRVHRVRNWDQTEEVIQSMIKQRHG